VPTLEVVARLTAVFWPAQVTLSRPDDPDPSLEDRYELARRLGGGLDPLMEKLGDLTQVFEEARIFAKL
jgi:hypothetical protein